MTLETAASSKKLAWLVSRTGPSAGVRYLIRGTVTRVGRSPDNDIIIEGEDAAVVSGYHLEIRREAGSYRVIDLASTNGTWLDGVRIGDAELTEGATIRLGPAGPELAFVLEELPPVGADRTVVLPPEQPPAASDHEPGQGISTHDERLLKEAVARARRARRSGAGNQTMVLMRDVLQAALRRSGRRFKRVIAGLVAVLVAVTAYGSWRIAELKKQKAAIDRQIHELESALAQGSLDPRETENLLERLDQYQDRARSLQQDVFYRFGAPREQEDFLRQAIRQLMAEFGAESYSIPPEFVENVSRYVRRYQGPDRPSIERALRAAQKDLEAMRAVFQEQQLPPDLVFLVLVESAFLSESESRAGAAGLWQFTPRTARAYGLRVARDIDERLDTRKATMAASQYIRELILEFGAGSSVMLALAAYNLGPGKVKAAVRRSVANPIKQRDFWYLYRARALPAETREYVPKVLAAMIIGRHPDKLGF